MVPTRSQRRLATDTFATSLTPSSSSSHSTRSGTASTPCPSSPSSPTRGMCSTSSRSRPSSPSTSVCASTRSFSPPPTLRRATRPSSSSPTPRSSSSSRRSLRMTLASSCCARRPTRARPRWRPRYPSSSPTRRSSSAVSHAASTSRWHRPSTIWASPLHGCTTSRSLARGYAVCAAPPPPTPSRRWRRSCAWASSASTRPRAASPT
mmetsp:Transcript_22086/g.47632  ORF Transcript_22086/g.47632 Transcript_22086/m.47632 type:complete len:207 (-) Transcript_22086:1889-2509(-)